MYKRNGKNRKPQTSTTKTLTTLEALESRRLLAASIAGVVFSDNNANGSIEASDTLLANKKMFLDLNKNGNKDSTEPTATTDASGKYTFANLNAGTYRVRRADLPAGYEYSTSAENYVDVTLATGQNKTGVNFGAIVPGPTPPPPAPVPTPTVPTGNGAVYYVTNSGSDSASGTSMTSAWKTINRINSQKLKPGDTILFAMGQTFSGTISIPSTESGTKSSPITFGVWGSGSGRATIKSGTASGLDMSNSAGVVVNSLNFVGAGMTTNKAVGIWVHSDQPNKSLSTLRLKNVDVSGYGQEGMRILVAVPNSSFSDVRVEYSNFHDNLYGGIKATAKTHNINKNYLIDHVNAWNGPGSKAAGGVTGSGIYLADVENAKISRCVVHDNGKDGAAPVGIWAAGSNRVTIEYCESYNNHTATATDGGGFDFDWDVTNSTIQYCYSHNNDGPGYILAAGDHVNSGNTLRYNVSENDGRRNGRAGVQLWGNVSNANIYNNVIFITATGSPNTAAFYAHDVGSNGKRPQGVNVQNNVFYTTGGAKVLNITNGVANYGTMKFNGNAYYTNSGTFKIQWGSTLYTALGDWQTAKSQEVLNGAKTGFQGDPKLNNAGTGGTIGNADKLKELTAYKLSSLSPLVNKGVNPPTFLASALTDFYGDTLPKGGKYDVGIDEVA